MGAEGDRGGVGGEETPGVVGGNVAAAVGPPDDIEDDCQVEEVDVASWGVE